MHDGNLNLLSNSSGSMRFSLRSLLLILSLACLILAPVHWLGGAYLVSAAFTMALVVACVLGYRSKWPSAALLIAGVPAMLGFPFAIVLLVFWFHAVLNAIVSLPLVLLKVCVRTYAASLTCLAIGVYGCAIWQGSSRIRELKELQAAYPLQSLESRLSFNKNSTQAGPLTPIALSPKVASQLDELENKTQLNYYGRAWDLYELHEQSYRHFARAAGFGVMRMPSITKGTITLPASSPVMLPIPLTTKSPSPPDNELFDAHRLALLDFTNPIRTGYVRSRNAVAGFESHGFSAISDQWPGRDETISHWQVVRLELVSLLRHDEPRVYIAESLPQMDQLAEVPHRPLNTFESAGLPQLETAEDIVVDQQPGQIQMLGAVRAANTCLECHEGQRGQLLGAFSYEVLPLDHAISQRSNKTSDELVDR